MHRGVIVVVYLLSICFYPFEVHAQTDLAFNSERKIKSELLELPDLTRTDAEVTVSRNLDDMQLNIRMPEYGRVFPDSVLLIEPGEVLKFDIGLLGASTQEEEAANPAASRTSNAPGRYVLKSEREIALDCSAGAVLAFQGSKVTWKAPMQAGWERLVFSITEARRFFNPNSTTGTNSKQTIDTNQQVLVMVKYPFNRQGNGLLDQYPIGIYPDEKSAQAPSVVQRLPEKYSPPPYFIKVTPQTQDKNISRYYRLSDFSPAAEHGKIHFIALQTRLLHFMDELQKEVITEFGEKARVRILRAFLSPNERVRLAQQGVRYTKFNRYQYGDAAAFIIDADGDKKLDDLNRDGNIDEADARSVADVVERVQRVLKVYGGLGVVAKSSEPGWADTPYIVVDTRGLKMRW